jgi:nucleotide-binding universal stress UspA family protein
MPAEMAQSQGDIARVRASGEERLRDLLPQKAQSAQEPLLYVEFGPVEEKIVGIAIENNVDLIVLATTAASPSATHVAEGVAYKVVGAAPCPVLKVLPIKS